MNSPEEEFEIEGFVHPGAAQTLESIIELRDKGLISAAEAARYRLLIDQSLVAANNVASWTRVAMGKNSSKVV